MFFVYILKSTKNDAYYIGCTNNTERRLVEHNKGISKYTKNARPWTLVYKESYKDLRTARKREREIKNWKKRARIEKLIKDAAIV